MKRITGEDWVKRAKKVHGDRYDYSQVVYISSRSKVDVICREHGKFEQSANSHAQGSGCPKCYDKNRGKSRQLTTEEFIARAKTVHGGKYDYSETSYTNSYTKVNIICRVHGLFSQNSHHHLAGHGCTYCGNNITKSRDEFVKQAIDVHGDRYDYSLVDYVNNIGKVKIVCREHGVFEQAPVNHTRQSQGCPHCAGIMPVTTEQFIKRAKEKHSNKYDYTKVRCERSSQCVVITCPVHGDFRQSANSHLCGSGCNKCVIRGYSRSRFSELSDTATIYLVRVFDDIESFYKVGITTKSVRERMSNSRIPYDYEVIAAVLVESSNAFDLEKVLHRELAKHNYLPRMDFHGKTECFLLSKHDVAKILDRITKKVGIIC